MSDIFISYKREEQSVAQKLANALARKGWSVWWDPKLRAGEHFDDVIEKALMDAKCVIVLWSQRSVESRYIKDEASDALKRNKLVPVAIEEVDTPFRFAGLHTVQLFEWDGSESFPAFQKLIADIETLIGSSPIETKHGESETKAAAKRSVKEEARCLGKKRKERMAREPVAKEDAEGQGASIDVARTAISALRRTITTIFFIIGLALIMSAFFYVTSEPLDATEITIVAIFCAAVVLSTKWLWTRLRRFRSRK